MIAGHARFRRLCLSWIVGRKMTPMTVKIQCDCGQRYFFEVDSSSGQMPIPVACPVCGADGTSAANEILARGVSLASSGVRLATRGGQPTASSVEPVVYPPVKYRTSSLKRFAFSLVWAVSLFIGSGILLFLGWRVYFAMIGAPRVRPSDDTLMWFGSSLMALPAMCGIIGAILGVSGLLPGTRKYKG